MAVAFIMVIIFIYLFIVKYLMAVGCGFVD